MAMLILFSGFAAVILVGSALVAINDTLEALLSETHAPERAGSPVAAHRLGATAMRNDRGAMRDRRVTPRHAKDPSERSPARRPTAFSS